MLLLRRWPLVCFGILSVVVATGGFPVQSATPQKNADCASLAMRYPRTLSELIPDAGDRRHLANLFFNSVLDTLPVKGSQKLKETGGPNMFFHILLRLRHNACKGDLAERTWRILQDIRTRIHRDIGTGFLIWRDFFSYRALDVQPIFPVWHQDIEFQSTDSKCSNFNLWILLDESGGMDYSFDLLEVQRNPWLYEHNIVESPGKARLAHGVMDRLLDGRTQGPNGEKAVVSRVPLRPGDGLVLNEVEPHRTDNDRLNASQWRLALGFKVMQIMPKVRNMTSHITETLAMHNRDWPGLFPPWPGDPYSLCSGMAPTVEL